MPATVDHASYRLLEFFTTQSASPNTRRAYAKGAANFCARLERRGVLSIAAVNSIQVAAYVEELGRRLAVPGGSRPSARCSTIRTMFD